MIKRILILGLILCFGVILDAQTENYSKARISLVGKDIGTLASLGLEVDHGEVAKGRYIISDFSDSEINRARENGFKVDILIDNISLWYKEHSSDQVNVLNARDYVCELPGGDFPDWVTPENYSGGSMGGYLTYTQALDELDEMATLYPDLIKSKEQIGDIMTTEGRPLYWMRISNNPEVEQDKPKVLYTALHHAREPNSLSQLVFYMWYLLENYSSDDEVKYLVDNTEMYFIPIVNPDGYVYNELTDPEGGGQWRKNRWVNPDDGNVYGVDLNRNYGYNWGYDDVGSSTNFNHQTYRGPSAFSEPETQIVRDFCNTFSFDIALNYHTFSNLLIHPWGYSDMPTEDHPTFKAFGKEMTKENKYVFGTGTETVGYIVNGDSDDWMYGEQETKDKIFSMTPEVGPQNYGFWPPESAIDGLNKQNMYLNLAAPWLVMNLVEVTDTEGKYISEDINSLKLNVKRVGLRNDPVQISISSSSSFVTINTGVQSFNLPHLEENQVNFSFSVDNNTPFNTEIDFVIHIDYGGFEKEINLSKIWIKNSTVIEVFNENGDNMDNWDTNSWGISTSEYVSAGSSITDSPGTNYSDQTTNSLYLVQSFDLSSYSIANLRYWAKWDIETGWDWVQVLISNDGINFTPLCGKYSKAGNESQDLDQPIYDGVQSDWVQENIDISEYIGETVYLQFKIVSDNYQNGDGFYFDDLVVEGYSSGTTDLEIVFPEDAIKLSPNPVEENLKISIGSFDEEVNSIILSNIYGSIIKVIDDVNDKKLIEIDMSNYPEGLYFVSVNILDGSTISKKFFKLSN